MESISKNDSSSLHWYAMKVFYNKTEAITCQLKQDEKECWIPMEEYCYERRGKKVKIERPALSLLFFQSTENYARELRWLFSGRMVIYHQQGPVWRPLAIPEHEMTQFRRVYDLTNGRVEFIEGNTATLRLGERVRVIAGPFAGIEGYIKRIQKNKRLLVVLDGVCAIMSSYIPRRFLEPVIEEET